MEAIALRFEAIATSSKKIKKLLVTSIGNKLIEQTGETELAVLFLAWVGEVHGGTVTGHYPTNKKHLFLGWPVVHTHGSSAG